MFTKKQLSVIVPLVIVTSVLSVASTVQTRKWMIEDDQTKRLRQAINDAPNNMYAYQAEQSLNNHLIDRLVKMLVVNVPFLVMLIATIVMIAKYMTKNK